MHYASVGTWQAQFLGVETVAVDHRYTLAWGLTMTVGLGRLRGSGSEGSQQVRLCKKVSGRVNRHRHGNGTEVNAQA